MAVKTEKEKVMEEESVEAVAEDAAPAPKKKKTAKTKGGDFKLLIVESPSKAKTISKYLGSDYRVVASVGHVRDLPKSNKGAIDIPHGYIPKYIISPGKQKVVDEIHDLAERASMVILATDPDREGEAIAWHVKEAAHLKNPKRVTFHEITKEAVEEALEHPREIDDNLKQAQEARRVLDRLVGYELSGLIWKKVRYGLSAGRVQSPALRIIMEREREIRAFIPEQYFVLTAEFETEKKDKLIMECVEQPKSSESAAEIVEIGKKAKWIVGAVEETEVKRSPKAPFTTSTLQQTASTRLGYSPSRTMMIAQKLYEGGHITYMRTDSTTLSGGAIAEAKRVIEKEYGAKYAETRQFKTKSKNAQEAHEAIRPTHLAQEVAGFDDDAKKLYRLIRNRTIASQMTDARMSRTKIIAEAQTAAGKKEEKVPEFNVTGSRILFDGWLKADPDSAGEDVILPVLPQKSPLSLIDLNSLEKFTEPPGRYTEAGLIKELEKRGIGRPSTYASIIKTIDERGYVEKVNKSLVPTDTGDVVSSFLEEHFASYISDDFTAHMEEQLDNIAIGTAKYIDTIDEVYKPLHKDIKEKDSLDKATTLGVADDKFKCPICGKNMIIKLGRGGKFLSCNSYPDCSGALTLEGLEIKGDTPIGTDPESGLPIFVKVGRFGPYVQLGEKDKKTNPKPRMASIPKEVDPTTLSMENALHYLSLPRNLGKHPDTGKEIQANKGRFGPYVVHDGDFRSLKVDDVFTITFERSLEIFAEEKKVGRRGAWKKKKAN